MKFKVLFYSPDGETSPVFNYLDELREKDESAVIKCLQQINNLPLLIYTRNKSIKPFTSERISFYELKVKHKGNEFRFFFIMEQTKVIVVYGFTKKTQKTLKKDKSLGLSNLEKYLESKVTISLDNI